MAIKPMLQIVQRPLFFALLFALLILGLYPVFTGNIHPKKMLSCFSFDPEWQIENLPVKEAIEPILHQKFYYLGQGAQSVVFQSEDKKTVLKFAKKSHFTLPDFYYKLHWTKSLEKFAQQKRQALQKRIFQYLCSQKLGFEKLQKECALLYVHINPSEDLPRSIMIFDKMNRSYTVDLNTKIFVLQKKMTSFQKVFHRYSKKDDVKNMQELLAKMVHFHASLLQKRCIDTDLGFYKNYGILDGYVICCDTGNLFWDPNLQYDVHYRSMFNFIFKKTRIWVHKNRRELTPFLEENIQSKLYRISQ